MKRGPEPVPGLVMELVLDLVLGLLNWFGTWFWNGLTLIHTCFP